MFVERMTKFELVDTIQGVRDPLRRLNVRVGRCVVYTETRNLAWLSPHRGLHMPHPHVKISWRRRKGVGLVSHTSAFNGGAPLLSWTEQMQCW